MTRAPPTDPDPAVGTEALLQAVQRAPGDAHAIAMLGRRRIEDGAEADGIVLLETAVALRPDVVKFRLDLAFALARRGDLIAAARWVPETGDPGVQRRIAKLHKNLNRTARQLAEAAREHERSGRLDEALASYALMAGHAPGDLSLRLEFVEFLLSVGRFAAAQAHLEELPEQDERVARLFATAQALRAMTPAGRSLHFWHGLYTQARRDLMAGRAVLAEPVLRELTLLHPDVSQHWVDLRAARLVRGKTREAEAVVEHAAADPSRAGGRTRVGLARPVSARGLLFDLHDRFPIVAKASALQQVHTPAELKATADACLVLDPGGQTEVVHPFFDLADQRAPPAVRIRRKESFVLALDNAMVVGRGAVITQKGELIAEQFLGRRPRKLHASVAGGLATFGPQLGREPIQSLYVDEPVFLCMGPTDLSFGDWIIQFPPRLLLAEAAQLDCRILVSAHAPAKYLDMLEQLGVDRRRLIIQKDLRANVYRRLYAPSWPHGPMNAAMRNWLGIYRRASQPGSSAERALIYLTRRHIRNRPLINEDEICDLFASHGFRIVVPDDLTQAETVALFSNPACVAGPWGSSFENLVFSQGSTIAYALMPAYHRSYMHSVGALMHAARVRFGYVRGEPRAVFGPNTSPWYMPPDLARRGLEQVLDMVRRQDDGGWPEHSGRPVAASV